MENDPRWMINPKAGVMSVPKSEVKKRLAEGWTECDNAGQSSKPEVFEPKKKKK